MAKKPVSERMDGPIPGENYTSDTKNYPWHRPPEETDFNKVVEKSVDRIFNDPSRTATILTLLEQGDTIMDIVTGGIRVAVGKGKMSIDHGILAAGPVAKAVETLAKQSGVSYERGWDQEPKLATPERIRAYTGSGKKRPTKMPEPKEAPAKTDKPTGFMDGPASSNTQDKMLGRSAEEETSE